MPPRTMHIDPRARVSVGIDGRQYVRKPAMYVDVLGMPTITEAVHAASEMLRRGIETAMASNIENESIVSARQEKIERSKPQQAQAPTSARPDAASVYSAVTKRVRKPPPETADASKQSEMIPLPSEPHDMKDIEARGAEVAAGIWNSSKRAGPSILAKRSRPQSAAVSTASDRIFQPVQKRDRRTDYPMVATANAQGTGTQHPSDEKGLPPVGTLKQPSLGITKHGVSMITMEHDKKNVLRKGPQLQPKSAKSSETPAELEGPVLPSSKNVLKQFRSIDGTTEKQNSAPDMGAGLGSMFASGSDKDRNRIQPSTTAEEKGAIIHTNGYLSGKSDSDSNLIAIAPAGSRLISREGPGSPRITGARTLPPSWSQVSGKGVKKNTVAKSILARNPLLRKPGVPPVYSEGSPINATISLATSKPRGEIRGGISMQEAASRRASQSPAHSAPQPPVTAPDAPLPSPTGNRMFHVPGSEVINGVRPNGYTVTPLGVVKPMVTFNPKPKLPHKLRQASLDKMFQAWRDEKKFPEDEALSLALRTEQETYANAQGRVDYRAAVLGKLKEIRGL